MNHAVLLVWLSFSSALICSGLTRRPASKQLLASTLWQIKWLSLEIPCIGLSVIHTKDNNYNDSNNHV